MPGNGRQLRELAPSPGRRAFAVRRELPISPVPQSRRRIISTTGHPRERQRRGGLGRVTVLFVAAGFGCGTGRQISDALLVLAQTFVDDLPEQIVVGPGQEFNLGDQLGTHPVQAAEDERRTEAVRARRRDFERHLGDRKRLQAMPQSCEFGSVDAAAHAAGVARRPSVS